MRRSPVRISTYSAAPESHDRRRCLEPIGSSNFDDRSFETNDEITLSIRDEALARKLDAIFEKYVARATEIQLERWRKRGLSHKLTDHFCYTLNELL